MQDKPLIGYTHEGLPVEQFLEGQKLEFVPFSLTHDKGGQWSIALQFQCNKTPQGKKRPYMVLSIGRTVIQSGWLF